LSKLPGRFRIAFDNLQIKDFESENVDSLGRVLWVSQAVWRPAASISLERDQKADIIGLKL